VRPSTKYIVLPTHCLGHSHVSGPFRYVGFAMIFYDCLLAIDFPPCRSCQYPKPKYLHSRTGEMLVGMIILYLTIYI
jgi:hypothetical protein